ncbi:GtrA family protein [Demequina rhizosphaerae]|uniref:GtrA family protein n=1 Tax=Demequina rhizosphaerae TaxID=1638985 RepID=UPI00078164D6|nr:GtrA family protein [Demequina rhizosphaerae]
MSASLRTRALSRELRLYAFIGVSGVAIDFAVFAWLTTALAMNPVVASAISVTAGIANNFIWNSLINFRVRDRLPSRFASFYAIGLAGLVATVLAVWILTTPLGVPAVAARVVAAAPVALGQFAANKRLTFGRTTSRATTAIHG